MITSGNANGCEPLVLALPNFNGPISKVAFLHILAPFLRVTDRLSGHDGYSRVLAYHSCHCEADKICT